MNHLRQHIPILFIALISGLSTLNAQVEPQKDDTGKESVGTLKVSLIFGTNGDAGAKVVGEKAVNPEPAQLEALTKLKAIKFKHFKVLGADIQPVFRSYENWAAPLKGSKELLLSFQPRGEAGEDTLQIDLEFWQSHKKIMKSGPILKKGKPLFILGPQWRGGRLLIVVELMSLAGDEVLTNPESKEVIPAKETPTDK